MVEIAMTLIKKTIPFEEDPYEGFVLVCRVGVEIFLSVFVLSSRFPFPGYLCDVGEERTQKDDNDNPNAKKHILEKTHFQSLSMNS